MSTYSSDTTLNQSGPNDYCHSNGGKKVCERDAHRFTTTQVRMKHDSRTMKLRLRGGGWTFPSVVSDSPSLWQNIKEKDEFLLQKYKAEQVKSMWGIAF
jgi:hypothetical protein